MEPSASVGNGDNKSYMPCGGNWCPFVHPSETVANEGSALRGGASRSKSCPQKHGETEEERNEVVGSGGVGTWFILK